MATINVQHNLSSTELRKVIVGLAESSGIAGDVVEALSKSCACDDGPKLPKSPAMQELYSRFRGQYAGAVKWVLGYVEEILHPLEKAEKKYLARPLTKQEINRIQQAIKERFQFILDQMAPDEYPPNEETLNRWKALGIIERNVTQESFALSIAPEGRLIYNAFLFGKLHQAVEAGETFESVMTAARTLPLLKPDLYAIRVAEQQTGNYITAFGDTMAKEVGQLVTAKNRDIVRQMAVDFHSQRLHATDFEGLETDGSVETWQGFSSELARKFDDYETDWDRIGFYELHDAQSQGRGMELMETYGPQHLVYKMPLPTACPQCRFLYLEEDGATPRLFRLEEMLAWGNNIGRKPLPVKGGHVSDGKRVDGAEPLKPVAGQIHPWCQCSGPHLFTGYEPWAHNLPA